jgi:exopolyphosphatase/guanosine-5'-triphosphate,3'-diphosphate pyrophosphatase
MGFTDREIELIAQVARYHRKSQPSADKHPEYAALDADDQARVRSMAGILRVAIGMDRNHDAAVDRVEVVGDGVVALRLVPEAADADLTLERYSADHRSSLLSQQLGCEVVVES